MQTVSKQLWTQIVTIKNSKFATFLVQVSSVAEAEAFLKEHQDPKATHNCYAYIVGPNEQIKRFNDDGEPSRSAGYPILKVLEDKQLTNIVVLVRRYFHPPKLGVGGLMRGYQQSLLDYLAVTQLLGIIPSKKYQIIVPIALTNLIYQWQKIYQFFILDQISDGTNITFLVNLPNKIQKLPYHFDVTVAFIEDSFLITDN